MTLLIRDPLFQKHDTGEHPERPARLKAIEKRLADSGGVTEEDLEITFFGYIIAGPRFRQPFFLRYLLIHLHLTAPLFSDSVSLQTF